MKAPPAPEFSRVIEVTRLTRDGRHFEIAANPAERAALAKRFDLIAIGRLAAVVRLEQIPGGLYRLTAELDADVTQACVVSLAPVKSRVVEGFSVLYGGGGEAHEVNLDGAAETIEPIENGVIDIGEAVAQQLSLALDPFPHAPGAEASIPVGSAKPLSPFQALAALKKENNSKE
ncbi:MAG: YceD family protein [Stellaceae bacterium]